MVRGIHGAHAFKVVGGVHNLHGGLAGLNHFYQANAQQVLAAKVGVHNGHVGRTFFGSVGIPKKTLQIFGRRNNLYFKKRAQRVVLDNVFD